MKKIIIALVLSLLAGSAFAATPPNAKYGGHCAYGLTMGKQVPTDCSVSWTNPGTSDLYCFSSEEMKNEFSKNTPINVAKADAEFTKINALSQANAAMNQAANAVNQAQKDIANSATAPHGTTATH